MTSAEVQRLRRSKAARQAYLTKVMTELTIAIDAKDVNLVEDKLDVVKAKEGNLLETHEKLRQEDDDLTDDDLQTLEAFEASIIGSKSAAHRFLKGSMGLASGAATASRTQAKLPKLQIPRFNGTVQDWERFWQQFEAGVHENKNLSDVERFNYLRSMLTENAALTIAGLQLIASNYSVAVDLLQQKYGRVDVLKGEHFSCLLHLKRVSGKNAAELRMMYEEIMYRSRALQVLGKDLEECSEMICPVILHALPAAQMKEWYREAGRSQNPKFSELLKFVQGQVEMLEGIERTIHSRKESEGAAPAKKVADSNAGGFMGKKVAAASALVATEGASSLNTSSASNSSNAFRKASPYCPFCEEKSHWGSDCRKFATVAERKDALQRLKRCFKCLRKNHFSRDCKQRITCKTCQKPHHMALCFQNDRAAVCSSFSEAKEHKQERDGSKKEGLVDDGIAVASLVNGCSRRYDVTVLQTLSITIQYLGKARTVFCLVDGGSERSFVTSRVVNDLKLERNRTRTLRVNAFGSAHEMKSEAQVNVPLIGIHGNELVITAFEVEDICHHVAYWEMSKVERLLQGRRGVWGEVMGTAQRVTIDLLIGADWYWRIMTGHMKRLSSFLMATESVFGWMLQGRAFSPAEECAATMMFVKSSEESFEEPQRKCEMEDQLLKHLIDQDKVERGEWNEEQTFQEEIVLQNFRESIVFQEGRYEVKIPWNNRKMELGRNFNLAENRLRRLIFRLKRVPELFERYKQGIYDYLADGHIEEVEFDGREEESMFYMPHHPIVREDRKTTKLRIVFDASAKEEGWASLNDCQDAGPNLNPDIVELLLRFRLYEIAMTSDLSKAFLQIRLQASDRDATRFLWTEDGKSWATSQEQRVYRMTRVLFGMKSSPFLLAATLRFHAEKYLNK